MILSEPVNKFQGCELEESLRRYYLDAMGIQAWEQKSPVVHEEPDSVNEVSQIEPTSVIDQWSLLQQEVTECTACGFHATRQQTVFGSGDRQAALLVIGAAPNVSEDSKGEPFVDAEGELLTAMLKAIDIEREQVYLTNLVKCRPQNHDDVSPVEVLACEKFLRQQVKLIQPEMILLMGQQAVRALLDCVEEMSSLRTQQHQYEAVPLMVTYHPAELMQEPELKRLAWQDLKQLKRELDSCQ